jgi:hypothetical protein
MASSINASTSGAGGLITTADNTGNLNIQSGGSTVLALTSSGVAITGTLTATGTTFGNSTLKYVTDSTDIAVSSSAPTQTTVGSSFSVSIPTSGVIRIASFAGRIVEGAGGANNGQAWGIRISSTNYWFTLGNVNGTLTYFGSVVSSSATSTNYDQFYGGFNTGVNNAVYGRQCVIDIEANSVPTGTQTVQLIVAKTTFNYTDPFTLKGTTNTTRVGIEFVSAS